MEVCVYTQKESMEFLYAVIVILGGFLFKIKLKTILNPISMFLFFRGGILLLYSFHLYGLDYVSYKTLLLIAIEIVMFVLGGISSYKIKSKLRFVRTQINYKLYKMLCLVALIILILCSINTIQLLLNGTSAISIRYTSENIESNYILIVLRNFLALPIIVLSICVSFSRLIMGKKCKNYLLFSAILVMGDILARFSTYNIYLLVCACFFVFCFTRENRSLIDIKKNSKLIVILAIILLIVLITFREMNLLQHIYIYLSGSVVLLEKKMVQFLELGRDVVIGKYTYGMATFLGIIRPIANILERFDVNINLYESADQFYWPWLAIPMKIGENLTYNSFVSPVMYYYKDFGYLGIVIYSYIYGYICMYAYKNYNRTNNECSTSIYIYFFLSIFLTLMESPFVKSEFAITLILLLILFQNKKSRKGL